MSEIDDLKRLILKLDEAGRQDDAAKLADQVRQMQGQEQASPQAPPEKSAWDKITGGLWNILPQGASAAMAIGSGIMDPKNIGGPAVAQAITGPANLAAGAADAAMGGKSLMERLGYDPKSYKLPGREDIDKQGAEKARATFEGTKEYVKQYRDDPLGKWEKDPLGTLGDIASLLTGGAGAAAKIPLLARGAEIAGNAGRFIAPTKRPIANLINSAVNTARDIQNPGMKEMAKALGEAPDTAAHSVYAASPELTEMAKAVIADPGKALSARKGLLDAIQEHMDASAARQGPNPAFDPDTRMGSRYLAFDADALRPHFVTALNRANIHNDAKSFEAIQEAQKSLSELKDPKDPISRYSQALGAYEAVDEAANKLPDRDILSTLRTDVRSTLSQDPDMKAALAKLDADKRDFARRKREEEGSNRTDKSILAAADQSYSKEAKRSIKDLVRVMPYRGAGFGASLGYMLATGNYSPVMYAIAGAGSEMAAKKIASALAKPDKAKANMMNMLADTGSGVKDTLAKIEDYKKRGLSTNTLIENLLIALSQSHRMQQQEQ